MFKYFHKLDTFCNINTFDTEPIASTHKITNVHIMDAYDEHLLIGVFFRLLFLLQTNLLKRKKPTHNWHVVHPILCQHTAHTNDRLESLVFYAHLVRKRTGIAPLVWNNCREPTDNYLHQGVEQNNATFVFFVNILLYLFLIQYNWIFDAAFCLISVTINFH